VIVFIGVFSKLFGGSHPKTLEKTTVSASKFNVLAVSEKPEMYPSAEPLRGGYASEGC
jgi:hypothetical protein